MGNTYTVKMWVYNESKKEYEYQQVWAGEDLQGALTAMDEVKDKSGCIKLEWRP